MATPNLTQEEWVLDTRCSYHMTPYKDWFLGLEEIDADYVVMANNTRCKVVVFGSINLRFKDRTQGILTHVRYVPKLKRNLISLGML